MTRRDRILLLLPTLLALATGIASLRLVRFAAPAPLVREGPARWRAALDAVERGERSPPLARAAEQLRAATDLVEAQVDAAERASQLFGVLGEMMLLAGGLQVALVLHVYRRAQARRAP